MQLFRCGHCGTTVFFENDTCLSCAAPLGYAPAAGRLQTFWLPGDNQAANQADNQADNQAGAAWPCQDGGPALRPCANRRTVARCNWMLDATDPAAQSLCRSCRLTQLLPALDRPRNGRRWQRIEQAKRRLVCTLLGMGLVPEPKPGPGDALGLAFLLLEDQPGAAPVKTGHDRGSITLNVAEADDDHREAERVRLGEPTRTLLGHLRHEAAHYLHHRWIANTPAAEACRAAFGDERADYAQALARHYADGPPPGWAQHFISAYASSHPWEDWAETCAHVLLVLDAVQTASAWGLQLSGPVQAAPQSADLGHTPDLQQLVLQQWLPVAQFLNAMHRSLGRHDSYPFLMPAAVLRKMGVVQMLLMGAAAGSQTISAQR